MLKSRRLSKDDGVGVFGEDFMAVWQFLYEYQLKEVRKTPFHWGRWEWGHSLPFLDETYLDRIFVWEEEKRIVGLLTYETEFGEAFYVLDSSDESLKQDIIETALAEYRIEGKEFRIMIPDDDEAMKRIAAQKGLSPITWVEKDAIIDLQEQDLNYTLPEGFTITDLEESYDLDKHHENLYRGFNHGDPQFNDSEREMRRISNSGPHVVLSRNVSVVSPDGRFVSYCGTWYKEGSLVALVEPVATVPEFRKMGLGKAAVLEALRRCRDAGARYGLVGSDQQFYYNIGFVPFGRYIFWK